MTLTRRVLDRPLAAVRVVNMREEFADEGPDVILSRRAARGDGGAARAPRAGARPAQPARLRRGGLLPAVRRHARVSQLQRVADRARRPARGWRAPLPLLQLRAHRAAAVRQLRGAVSRARRASAPSGSSRKSRRSSPTRASAASIATRFGGGAASPSCSSRFARRELDVLVGTQMIAKGHDFPDVTLVGVISADVGLGTRRLPRRRADVSAAHAGRRPRRPRRAGRRGDHPDAVSGPLQHPAGDLAGLRGVLRQGDSSSAAAMRYPPVVAMINVVVRGKTYDAAMEAAGRSRADAPAALGTRQDS